MTLPMTVKSACRPCQPGWKDKEFQKHELTEKLFAPRIPRLPGFDSNRTSHVHLWRLVREVALSSVSNMGQSSRIANPTNSRIVFTDEYSTPDNELLDGLIPRILEGAHHVRL